MKVLRKELFCGSYQSKEGYIVYMSPEMAKNTPIMIRSNERIAYVRRGYCDAVPL